MKSHKDQLSAFFSSFSLNFSEFPAVGIYLGKRKVVACSLPSGKIPLQKIDYAEESLAPPAKEPNSSEILGARETISDRLAAETTAVKSALKRIGFRQGNVKVSISSSHYVTRYFEMPYLNEKERTEAIFYEAGRYIPYKLDETYGDFFVKVRESHGKKMLAVSYTAVKKEVINQYFHMLRQLGGRAVVIEPIFLSMARGIAIGSPKFSQNSSLGLIFVEADDSVNITLVHEGMVYLSHDSVLLDAMTNRDRFYQELKTSMEYMTRSWGVPPLKNFYLAGYGDVAQWREILTQGFGEHSTFEIISLPLVKKSEPQACAPLVVPVGLALRSSKTKSFLPDLQLLPNAIRGLDVARIKAMVVLELAIILSFCLIFRFFVLETQASQIRSKTAKMSSSAAAAQNQYQQQSFQNVSLDYETNERRLKVIRNFEKNRILVYKKMKNIGVTKPAAVWLQAMSYDLFGNSKNKDTADLTPTPLMMMRGFCFLSNPEKEVSAINEWADTLGKDAGFMENFKKLTVAEVKRSAFMSSDVTEFRYLIESQQVSKS